MKKFLLFCVIIIISILWIGQNYTTKIIYLPPKAFAETESHQNILSTKIQNYLVSKNSPLAADSDFLAQQPNWKLIIAISNAESTFCKHELDFNCWGLGGNGNLREYSSYKTSIQDENDFIASWQARGKWLTPEQMDGSYVQPYSATWLNTVNATLKDFQKF